VGCNPLKYSSYSHVLFQPATRVKPRTVLTAAISPRLPARFGSVELSSWIGCGRSSKGVLLALPCARKTEQNHPSCAADDADCTRGTQPPQTACWCYCDIAGCQATSLPVRSCCIITLFSVTIHLSWLHARQPRVRSQIYFIPPIMRCTGPAAACLVSCVACQLLTVGVSLLFSRCLPPPTPSWISLQIWEQQCGEPIMMDLHTACACGDYTYVRQLIDNGADCNAQNLEGWTPLVYAAGDSPVFTHSSSFDSVFKFETLSAQS
jgi:hypothetical protein